MAARKKLALPGPVVLSLDDVASHMRERFTPVDATKPVQVATITADEWNVLAQGINVADHLEAFLLNPTDDALAAQAAALIRHVRKGR